MRKRLTPELNFYHMFNLPDPTRKPIPLMLKRALPYLPKFGLDISVFQDKESSEVETTLQSSDKADASVSSDAKEQTETKDELCIQSLVSSSPTQRRNSLSSLMQTEQFELERQVIEFQRRKNIHSLELSTSQLEKYESPPENEKSDSDGEKEEEEEESMSQTTDEKESKEGESKIGFSMFPRIGSLSKGQEDTRIDGYDSDTELESNSKSQTLFEHAHHTFYLQNQDSHGKLRSSTELSLIELLSSSDRERFEVTILSLFFLTSFFSIFKKKSEIDSFD